MTPAPYRLTGPIGTRATFGLIVLQVDETIEHDLRRIFAAPDIALYVSRIPSGADVTPQSLAAMEADLPAAAALLPPAAHFDSIGYGCTSGTMQIGAARVVELVQRHARCRAVANPLTAGIAAFEALGIGAIGLLSPYIDSVAGRIRAAFETSGIAVAASLSFGEEQEAKVARIDPASIRAAALDLGRSPGVEAVFLSCTNLRTLDVLDDIEDALGRPVISSNQALAWAMLGQAGLSAPPGPVAPGRLLGEMGRRAL